MCCVWPAHSLSCGLDHNTGGWSCRRSLPLVLKRGSGDHPGVLHGTCAATSSECKCNLVGFGFREQSHPLDNNLVFYRHFIDRLIDNNNNCMLQPNLYIWIIKVFSSLNYKNIFSFPSKTSGGLRTTLIEHQATSWGNRLQYFLKWTAQRYLLPKLSKHLRSWNRYMICWLIKWLCRKNAAFLLCNCAGSVSIICIVLLYIMYKFSEVNVNLSPVSVSKVSLCVFFHTKVGWRYDLLTQVSLGSHCFNNETEIKVKISGDMAKELTILYAEMHQKLMWICVEPVWWWNFCFTVCSAITRPRCCSHS